MIDVSSLTDFQGKIALLIERRGNEGRRVKELCDESGATKSGVCHAINFLKTNGLIIRIDGDVPRYLPTPSVNVGTPQSPVPPLKQRKTPSKSVQININKNKLKEERKEEIFVKEGSQANAIPSPGILADGILAGQAGSEGTAHPGNDLRSLFELLGLHQQGARTLSKACPGTESGL